MLTPSEQKTVNYYDQNAADWNTRHGGGTMFDHFLRKLYKILPKGRILEVGPGSGSDAQKLIDHYGVDNYLGVEPALGLLKIARKRNPGARFVQGTIYDISKLDKFDGFWICAVLVHLPKARLYEALTILRKQIKTGGVGFISIMEGDSDMDESRPGRYFTLWSKAEFEDELKEAGFSILEMEKIETNASPWLAYILRV